MTEKQIWDLIFAQLVAWRGHPGYSKGGVSPPSITQCAGIATLAIAQRRTTWASDSSQADSESLET